ncbi:MAG: hypothetical protein KKC99_11370 [Proteobacteria bacterium]|nr:hypothetical protein [Pseudomonadota bacterium]
MRSIRHHTPLNPSVRGRFALVLILLLVVPLLSGCEKQWWQYLFPKHQATAQAGTDTAALYRAAIEDAKIAEPDEIVTSLTAINSYNPDLIWEDDRVLMTVWTDWDGYDNKQGQAMTLTRPVWVTAAQELRLFCLDYGLKGEELSLRLRQLLGLKPDAPYDRMTELWVKPDDMFRPSPDPEISDREAQLDFPGPRRYINISATHRRWFERLKDSSYGEDGYPWTRLGYTYDWGNTKSEVGLSEFVIRKGAQVIIRSTWTTDEYCTMPKDPPPDDSAANAQ